MNEHISMVKTAVDLLKRKRSPQKFNKIYKEVCEKLGFTESQKDQQICRFYNDLSLSSIFVYIGDNTWDLKERQTVQIWEKESFIDPKELKTKKTLSKAKKKSSPKKSKTTAKKKTAASLKTTINTVTPIVDDKSKTDVDSESNNLKDASTNDNAILSTLK